MRQVFDIKSSVIKDNPLLQRELNFEDPNDLKLLDDTRQFVLYFGSLCFDKCISLNYPPFTAYEKKCVQNCVQISYEGIKEFFKAG